MLPSRSLLFTLNRCSSSTANRTFCEGSAIFRSYRTRMYYSRLLQSAQDVCVAQYAGCFTNQNVRLFTSSASSPQDPNQDYNPEIIQCLRDSGFPEDACSQILVNLPLRLDQNKLTRTINYWGACQFGHDRLVYLLTENPDLLLVDQQQIMSCFTFLSKLFSRNYVYKTLLNCPQVMFEKHSEVSSKLDFLNKKLGVPNSEIVTSSSLGQPLERMRVRYEFLKRCGIYKTVVAGVATTNPSLSEMFDTSDEQFAKQVARLNPLEFEVFTNLFTLERDDDEDADSDSD